jgi:hypothetical protein
MRHLILAIPTCAFLLALGVYHGLATDRWTDLEGDGSPGKCFADMPANIGDWTSEPLPRQADDDARTAVQNRKFINRNTGRWVLTSLTSGRPGRAAIHDPEHCYLGSGYKIVDAIRQETLNLASGEEARFWTGHFEKKKPTGIESIRIYWGWSAGGPWQAPAYPRLLFAGKPCLHKLYMIHPVPAGDAQDDTTSYREFMLQYVAELNRHLEP